jgi:hypothetical protein
MIMPNAILALFIALAFVASAAAPASTAEYRKPAGQSGAADARLPSTPDIGNSNGDVNTDPAMTGRTGLRRATTTDGNTCRTGGGQSYPNANTDNPPGLQPCPR